VHNGVKARADSPYGGGKMKEQGIWDVIANVAVMVAIVAAVII